MPKYTAHNPTSQEFFVPAGEYKVKVIEAKDDTSKSGNDMIKLKLRVILPDGSNGPSLFDYLVFTTSSSWKVDAFLKSTDAHPGDGKEIDVKAEELIGLEGSAKLLVETYKDQKQNKVETYLFEEF